MNIRMRFSAATGLLLAAMSVSAQTWPAKPVKFFVAGDIGSAPDLIMRLIGERLVKIWGEQVIVENRAGAAGNLGTEAAARAVPDGYSLLFGQAAPLAMNQYTFKSLSFNADKDFAPVVHLGLSPMMIAVNTSLPVNTIADLLALAKAQPGKLSFGTSSSRNIPHLTGEMLNNMGGVKILHVPYKSNSQAALDAISGLTHIYIDGVPPMTAHIKSGRLRVIATSSPERLPNFPDVPAVAETLPGFQLNGWFAIMAPTGTPGAVIARVNQDVNTVVKIPEVAGRLLGFGMYGPGGTPESLARFLRSERENYAKAVKAAGIAPE
jgi:tripartite-type tricarboxylate transporter receptor subunit TctC